MTDRSTIRVLVVDDEPSVRESLGEFLEDFEFEVSVAECAEEALDLIGKERYDVAIVDLRLPGMSGDALILKIHDKLPHMHFLIHTGSVAYSLSEDLEQIGVRSEYVFFKPLQDLALLVEGITKLLRQEEAD